MATNIKPIAIVQLVLCLFAVVLGSLILISFGIYAPHFVNAFDAPISTISIAASLVLLATGVAAPVIGRFLDSVAVKRVYMVGALFIVPGLLGVSYAQSAIQLLVLYSVLGIAAAVFSPLTAVKHVTVWFPRHLALATSIVVVPFGAVLFPPLTQYLIDDFGWRQSFLIYAVAALAIVVALLFLKNAPSDDPADSEAHVSDQQSAESGSGSRLSAAQIYRPLLASPVFWYGMIAFCVFLASPISLLTHFMTLTVSKGMSIDNGVFFMTVMGIASIFGGPVNGMICDRIGPRASYILVAGVTGSALLLLVGTSGHTQFLAAAVILGFFLSAAYVFFVAYLTQIIGRENFGTGFGLATLITAIIAAAPPVLAGAVFDATGSYDRYFVILAALSIVAGIGAAVFGQPQPVHYREPRDQVI